MRLFRAEAALFGDLDDGEWRAKAYFYDSERGYPGYIDRNIPDRIRNQDRQWDTNFFLQGSLTRKPLPFYTFFIRENTLTITCTTSPDEEDSMYIDNRYHQQEAYVLVGPHVLHLSVVERQPLGRCAMEQTGGRPRGFRLSEKIHRPCGRGHFPPVQPHLRTGKPALHPCDRYHEMERNGSRSQERIHPHSHRLLETPTAGTTSPCGDSTSASSACRHSTTSTTPKSGTKT